MVVAFVLGLLGLLMVTYLIVGLDHHDGAFLATATGSMGETGLQNIAAPEVHESSGSSRPSPVSRSAVSAASKSISSFVHGV